MMERPAKRPANSVLASGREVPIELPDWQRGLADYLARREQPEPEEPRPQRRGLDGAPPAGAGAAPDARTSRRTRRTPRRGRAPPAQTTARSRRREAPGRRRRRLHRLQLRAPPPRRAPRRLGAGARQAHLRRAAARTSRGFPTTAGARRGRHRRPRRRPRRGRGLRRGRQLRRRVPRRPLDRVARRVHQHRRLRHLRAARGRARRRRPPPPGLDRRGLRRPRGGHGHRGLAAGALLALLGLEGRRRPARRAPSPAPTAPRR